MIDRRPATLHYLACYVLYRFGEEIAAQGLRGDLQRNHRIVYQNVLFLCGDALRTATPPCDLGLQTSFQTPTPERPFQPLARMTTVQTVLKQCVNYKWFVLPGPRAHPANFQLTPDGKTVAISLRRGSANEFLLKPSHLQIIDELLARWVGAPAWDFAPALRKVVANAYLANTIVPHYDLSDESLAPFLEGVARRARSTQA